MAIHDRQQADRIARQGMSPRQQALNRLWSYYKTEQYASRMTTWDGHKVMDELERESIAHTQVVPPGFWDPGGRFDDIPLALRKPSAPYHLVRVVVNRFTGLLFSAKMHPQISLLGAADLQQWIDSLVKTSRLWIRMAHARMYGGAQGSVAMTFQFRNGRPWIEVHDPRWCTPLFRDVATGDMEALEIRYQYPREEYDKGVIREVWYWYRRLIDCNSDTVFKPALVGDGDEPVWEVQQRVEHGCGEFPGVWIRNTPSDDQDGEPDCQGIYDTVEEIDGLIAQASMGAKENCDPTLVAASDELETNSLRKGSFNALKLEKGGSANYAEMTGSGVDAALKVKDDLRKNALEVVQCVLESERAAMTATEVERRFSSMHQRGDLFREQYGEMGVKPLLGKMIRAVLKLRQGKVDPNTNTIVIQQVFLLPIVGDDGKLHQVDLPPTLEHVDDNHIDLQWPDWVELGPSDAQSAAGAVTTARTASMIDQESGVKFLAPYFRIEDPNKALEAIRAEEKAKQEMLLGEMMLEQRANEATDPNKPIDPNTPAPATPATGPGGGAPIAETGKAQDVAFNGAQVKSAMELAIKIATREVMPDAAIIMFVNMFNMAEPLARQLVEAQLLAEPPAPTPPPFARFGGGPPKADGPPKPPDGTPPSGAPAP